MKRNYDSIAWFYDRLAQLIFGKTLINTQLYLIKAIPPGSHILIAGGGTGWILEEIAKLHSSGLSITYADASAKMIALAQKRKYGDNKVTFIAAAVEAVNPDQLYDVVLTPFLFDNFTDHTLQKICEHIDAHLKSQGLWLYCDFQNTGVLWQRAVLNVMYVFFRSSCGIEATHLPDANAFFIKHQYKISAQKTFLKEFITAVIYQKA